MVELLSFENTITKAFDSNRFTSRRDIIFISLPVVYFLFITIRYNKNTFSFYDCCRRQMFVVFNYDFKNF